MKKFLITLVIILFGLSQLYSQERFSLRDGRTKYRSECIGTFFDTGGDIFPYLFNESAVLVISPPNASNITFTFPVFDVEPGGSIPCNYDKLSFYNGTSTSTSNLIGRYCNDYPPPSSITSSSGTVTIVFESDGTNVEEGFEVRWQCGSGNSKPVVDFTSIQDSTCDGRIDFVNLSSLPTTLWFWEFGDGTTSLAKNPSHTYTTSGVYTVKLTASNSFGMDTLVKTNSIYVDLPVLPVTTNDTVCIGGTAKIAGTSTDGITWYDAPTGGNIISTNDTLTVPAVFSDAQYWAESSSNSFVEKVGETRQYEGPGGYSSSNSGIIFDVKEELDLLTVDVYANSAGTRAIELRDSNNNVLMTQNAFFFSFSSLYRITLNYTIQPGNNYRLVANGSGDLYQNTRCIVYPYSIPNKIDLKRSTNSINGYTYFYNWTIRSKNCSSPRVSAGIKVDTNCNVTSIIARKDLENDLTVYPNPTTGSFEILSKNQSPIESIIILDSKGREVVNSQPLEKADKIEMNLNGLESGLYFVKIYSDKKWVLKKLILK